MFPRVLDFNIVGNKLSQNLVGRKTTRREFRMSSFTAAAAKAGEKASSNKRQRDSSDETTNEELRKKFKISTALVEAECLPGLPDADWKN